MTIADQVLEQIEAIKAVGDIPSGLVVVLGKEDHADMLSQREEIGGRLRIARGREFLCGLPIVRSDLPRTVSVEVPGAAQ